MVSCPNKILMLTLVNRIVNVLTNCLKVLIWVMMMIGNSGCKVKDREMILSIDHLHISDFAPKTLSYLAFHSFDLSVSDEGYSRNVLCALNLISTLLLILIKVGKSVHFYTVFSDFNMYYLSHYCEFIFIRGIPIFVAFVGAS